jgi:AcrR family transcriptional regulator
VPTAVEAVLAERAARYSAVQRRTIDVAQELFASEGVGGTSFQMIADRLGVTKAAVYHQFKTKEAIVIAVLEVNLAPLELAVAQAEASVPTLAVREALLASIIERAVVQRRAISTLQSDPILVRTLNSYEPSRQLWQRLFTALTGDKVDARSRARAAVLSATIGSVGHPFVVDVPDGVLQAEIFRIGSVLLTKP